MSLSIGIFCWNAVPSPISFFPMCALVFFLILRICLAWLADYRLRVPRLRLRASLSRATMTFFSTPEIK